MVGVGDETTDIDCGVPLPVEPRKRYVFFYDSPSGPGLDCSLVTDTTNEGGGVWFRREGLGNKYICGMSPTPDQEPDPSDLSVIDHDFFTDVMWPRLAHRVPAFEELKVLTSWAGYYDYNYIDCNLIIGPHPYYKNFIFANGSSGHGVQHAPAIGRAISELIAYDQYRTVNLENLTFERFLEEDMDLSVERNIF